MDIIKTYIFNHFKTLFILTSSIIISVFILMIRLKITHSFFYIFLVWNLALAVIPYAITVYLKTKTTLNKSSLVFGFIAWVLFLPNAPYLITDLIHLRLSETYIIWLDIIMVSAFSISGLLLFYYSLNDMRILLKPYFKKHFLHFGLIIIIFSSSFGIYLGRFLRYNSWEILSQPQNLITDVFQIIINPNQNQGAWLFTLGFGIFLWIGSWVFKTLNQIR